MPSERLVTLRLVEGGFPVSVRAYSTYNHPRVRAGFRTRRGFTHVRVWWGEHIDDDPTVPTAVAARDEMVREAAAYLSDWFAVTVDGPDRMDVAFGEPIGRLPDAADAVQVAAVLAASGVPESAPGSPSRPELEGWRAVQRRSCVEVSVGSVANSRHKAFFQTVLDALQAYGWEAEVVNRCRVELIRVTGSPSREMPARAPKPVAVRAPDGTVLTDPQSRAWAQLTRTGKIEQERKGFRLETVRALERLGLARVETWFGAGSIHGDKHRVSTAWAAYATEHRHPDPGQPEVPMVLPQPEPGTAEADVAEALAKLTEEQAADAERMRERALARLLEKIRTTRIFYHDTGKGSRHKRDYEPAIDGDLAAELIKRDLVREVGLTQTRGRLEAAAPQTEGTNGQERSGR